MGDGVTTRLLVGQVKQCVTLRLSLLIFTDIVYKEVYFVYFITLFKLLYLFKTMMISNAVLYMLLIL